jgi:hypothetical protein
MLFSAGASFVQPFLDPITSMFALKAVLKRSSLLAILLVLSTPLISFGQSYKLFDSSNDRVTKSGTTATISSRFVVDRTALTELRRFSTIEIKDVPLVTAGSNDVQLVDLQLTEFSVFGPNAVITCTTEQGLVAGPQPSVKLYRGTVKGVPGSKAYLALGTNDISGSISTPEADYSVGYEIGADNAMNAVIMDVRSIPQNLARAECHVTDDERYAPFGITKAAPLNPKQPQLMRPMAAATVAAEMAIECDFEMYEHFGSNEQTVIDWVAARMGAITTVYENELGCALQITNLNIFKVADPYPTVGSIGPLLDAFTGYWATNKTSVKRTLAHLFSRQAFENPNYSSGLAWLNVLCNKNIGYAVTRVWGSEQFPTIDDGVIAHEIGHNFGSSHTHNCDQWGIAIDSCVGAESSTGVLCYEGSKKVKGTIMSYCDQRSFSFGSRVQQFLLSQIEATECLVPVGPAGGAITVTTNNVTIAGVKLNESKDTTLVGFFKNTGTLPLKVLSASSTGSSDFEIISPALPLTLNAKQSKDLKIRYNAASEQTQNATITFTLEGNEGVATLNLTGRTAGSGGGDTRPLGFSAGGRKVEWGEKKVGVASDTQITVYNKTNAAIATLQPKWDPTTTTVFSIIGNKLLTIPAGGAATLTLRFNAPANKTYSAKLIIPFGTGQDTLTLSGVGSFNPGGGSGVGSSRDLDIDMMTSPNPFSSVVSVDLTLPGELSGKLMTVEVFNVLGTSVGKLFEGRVTEEKLMLNWKPESLDAGTYYVVARVDDAVLTRKIIYKH